jgi:hypothetical protein
MKALRFCLVACAAVVGCTFDAEKLRTPGRVALDAGSDLFDGMGGDTSSTGGALGTGGAVSVSDSAVGGAGGTGATIPVSDAGRDVADVGGGETRDVESDSSDRNDVGVAPDGREAPAVDLLSRDADADGLRSEGPRPEAGFEAGPEAGREAGREAGPEAAPDLAAPCPAACFTGCNVGCRADGQCVSCTTCTCSGDTGICHC